MGWNRWVVVAALLALAAGCVGEDLPMSGYAVDATGGASGALPSTGGEATAPATGGTQETGGVATGGTDTGGAGSTCGTLGDEQACQCGSGESWWISFRICEAAGWGGCYCEDPGTGGAAGSAPEATGGAQETGGTPTGGTVPTTGGTATGGDLTGGTAGAAGSAEETGGSETGGAETGGEASGGEPATGGTGPCTYRCVTTTRTTESDPVRTTTITTYDPCQTALTPSSFSCTQGAGYSYAHQCAVDDEFVEQYCPPGPDGTGGTSGTGGTGGSCSDGEHDCYDDVEVVCDNGIWTLWDNCVDGCGADLQCNGCNPLDYPRCDGPQKLTCDLDGGHYVRNRTTCYGSCSAGEC